MGLALAYFPLVTHMGDYFDSVLIFFALAFFTCMEYIFSPKRFNEAKNHAKAVSEQHNSTIEGLDVTDDAAVVEAGNTAKVHPEK